MELGQKISASQLAGEFILPKDQNKKLVFIAGGIGVTPFRSMIKYLIDTNQKRDIVLFYSNKLSSDIVYRDVFETAEKNNGLKVIYVVTDEKVEQTNTHVHYGFLTSDMIEKKVPDYKEREFYISGPHGMVVAFEDSLQKIGVKKNNIKTDLFPGFA